MSAEKRSGYPRRQKASGESLIDRDPRNVDQQQHHTETCWKCAGFTSYQVNQKLWRWGPEIWVLIISSPVNLMHTKDWEPLRYRNSKEVGNLHKTSENKLDLALTCKNYPIKWYYIHSYIHILLIFNENNLYYYAIPAMKEILTKNNQKGEEIHNNL